MTYLLIALYCCLGLLVLSVFAHALSSNKENKQRWASFGAASVISAGIVMVVALLTLFVSRISS